MSTAADRAAWTRSAYRMGFIRPDDPCPFKKGTRSAAAWRQGRESRLLEGLHVGRNDPRTGDPQEWWA